LYHNLKQFGGDIFSFLCQRADKVIVGFIAAVNAGSPEPACNGFSAFGKEHGGENYSQSPLRSLMRDAAKGNNHHLPLIWENPFVEHRLTFPNVSFLITKHIGRMSRFYSSFVILRP
jgi:hypothetical protein